MSSFKKISKPYIIAEMSANHNGSIEQLYKLCELACENCNEVVGFVKYILKGSNADGKNIKRGDFFNGVNGTTLNDSNYISLLFGDDLNYTLNMATIENGTVISNGVNVLLKIHDHKLTH